MSKEIRREISPEKGYEIERVDIKDGKVYIFQSLIKNQKPMSVDEIEGRRYSFTIHGELCKPLGNYPTNMSTPKKVEAIVALIELIELRDAWNEGEDVEQIFGNRRYYIIDLNCMDVYSSIDGLHILNFKSERLAQEFLETFKDKIELLKNLL